MSRRPTQREPEDTADTRDPAKTHHDTDDEPMRDSARSEETAEEKAAKLLAMADAPEERAPVIEPGQEEVDADISAGTYLDTRYGSAFFGYLTSTQLVESAFDSKHGEKVRQVACGDGYLVSPDGFVTPCPLVYIPIMERTKQILPYVGSSTQVRIVVLHRDEPRPALPGKQPRSPALNFDIRTIRPREQRKA